MTKNNIYIILNDVFREVFDDEDIFVAETTTAKDIEGWDSLTHIMLLSAIEEEFNIHFNMKEIQNLKNVGEMASIIEKAIK